ncbi:MAG: hypothetical protein G4V63_24520 [Candidatus Afipia apatlaquensis]|uniref:Uncharacterized protein n=1 Tax=Candidatus Afipia apatlaquensis TaxID=2712852 RepID=A0A7C9VP13_9BRAD|nr:hypothetical protein [Candidatus Afipia apatlaquensis]
MNETTLKHPHLVSAKFVTSILPGRECKVVLRVETDLPTNVMDPAYRADEMNDLTEMLVVFLSENTNIDSVEVSRAG